MEDRLPTEVKSESESVVWWHGSRVVMGAGPVVAIDGLPGLCCGCGRLDARGGGHRLVVDEDSAS